MTRAEPKALVEAQGVGPGLVAGELDEPAAALPGLADRPCDHLASYTVRTGLLGDADSLNLAAPAALVADPGQEGELHRSNRHAVNFGNNQPVVGIRVDGSEGVHVPLRQGVGELLTLRAERVIGKERDQRRQVPLLGDPEYDALFTHDRISLRHLPPSGNIPVMTQDPFVPTDFAPPLELVTDRFRFEPLGPEHNEADLAAWTSSIEHIRSTPGYPYGNWPPLEGMAPERNLEDLTLHAADFKARKGFTFTVLGPEHDVIGCVYTYPTREPGFQAEVRSWVRADEAHLDAPLADAVAGWLKRDWPWQHVYRHGRR